MLESPKPGQGRLQDLTGEQKRAILVGTYSGAKAKEQCDEQLNELESLGTTYGLETVLKLPCPIREYDAATFIGSGKVEEIKQLAIDGQCQVVIFDDEISPQQQRNLEKILERVVIDRTELILGVFAQRAQTREAKIQIELATFGYQMPRLRKMWSHLHRQRSGGASGGAVKGEGEKQIEIDRRIVRKQIDRLENDLEEIKKQRKTQRRLRERTGIPTFAIIGYTNVGKSTLLRALTDADVLVEDKLFATLDPITRKFVLPNGQAILLIDTVGFIRKIPHQLIAAFKSTLEEAVQADILLHLIDVSNPQAEKQAEATFEVLKELNATEHPIVTVLNKVDRCENRMLIQKLKIKYPKTVEISALNKTGFDLLMETMIQEISRLRKRMKLRVPQSHYALVSEVMRQGKVLSCEYEGNDILLEVEIPHHLEKKIAHFEVL
ncbi:MAG TPA: GTPase HflX [Chlamydiales bacterium]|nr:GTPase HflX [Chlamydiales bacterium]